MNNIFSVEYAKIEAERIIIYKRLENYKTAKNDGQFRTEKNLKGKVQGKLSDSAKKKIKNIINTWITAYMVKYKNENKSHLNVNNDIKFITLTLSQKQFTNDKEIKRNMLNNFLQRLKKNHKMKNYLWISETQKNGNLHFHIITDIYISHVQLRKYWNSIQQKHGYTQNYYKKYKNHNPNSTDIHALKKIKNIVAYLTKETTKGQQSRKMDGKIWSCNKELLNLKSFEVVADSTLIDVVDNILKQKHSKVYKDNFFSVIFFESIKVLDMDNLFTRHEFVEHYRTQLSILDGTYKEVVKTSQNESFEYMNNFLNEVPKKKKEPEQLTFTMDRR